MIQSLLKFGTMLYEIFQIPFITKWVSVWFAVQNTCAKFEIDYNVYG